MATKIVSINNFIFASDKNKMKTINEQNKAC